jgi:hypothetical protein
MVGINFDPNDYEPAGSFEPLPAGKYMVVVSSTEMKDAKIKPGQKEAGQYLNVVYDVVDEEFKGRKVFDRFNLVNESEQAVKIANSRLTSLCIACGIMRSLSDTDELKDIPFMLKVKVKRDPTGQYNDSNEAVSYEACEGAAKSAPAAATKKTAAPPAVKNDKPWKKKQG